MSSLLVLGTIFFLLLPYSGAKNIDQNVYESCQPRRCGNNGPTIRFPFRLKTQPTFCGVEGFELSCSNDETLLHLPFSGDYHVQNISYLYRTVTLTVVHETSCTLQLSLPNLTHSVFFFDNRSIVTLVNCTQKISSSDELAAVGPIDCMSNDRNFVYATTAYESVDDLPSTCRISQRLNISFGYDMDLDAITRAFTTPSIDLEWERFEGCFDCEYSGKYCWFNTTSNSTICFKQQDKLPLIRSSAAQ